jgi:AcrR family transcriptional regulator
MSRIVKKHQIRKSEILDTAQQLFYRHGYEKTSIAAVIENVGIAKGTFYHYFHSKSDLLDQIIERQAQMIDQMIRTVLDESKENALAELNNIFAAIGEYKSENKKVMLMMVQTLYSDENIVLLSKLTKSRIKIAAPQIAKVISRGVKEGLFHTENPEFTAEMILTMSTRLSEEFAHMALKEELNTKNKKKYLEKCRAFERAIERILGVQDGTITFCNKKIINIFFKQT